MSAIGGLLENLVIADFQNDSLLSQYPIREHDYSGMKAGDDLYSNKESPAVVTVTAINTGSFKTGSGIRRVDVYVEIRVNAQADGFTGTLLGQLSEAVTNRLQASANVQADGREIVFSSDQLKTFGILDDLEESRTESGFERIRVVHRTFIVAHVAGPSVSIT